MAHLFQSEKVKYLCSCGCWKPLCKIYFCRHCLKIRCGNCVSHEVDSNYCPNCLENMPSAEARLKKNRCANCFDCPSCKHTLSTRATSIQVPSPQDSSKSIPKKVYYLACGFCRWTSRDIGLRDQTVASGGWPEQENDQAAWISSLQEHYRALAQREKIERERKRYTRRRSYLHFSDKYGGLTSLARKRVGLPPLGSLSLKDSDSGTLEVTPAEAFEEVDELPPGIFDTPVNLAQETKLPQRLAQPEFQPTFTKDLFPRHKHLLIKRSQRCRQCEHNLSKPEYNPTSIKFKIQLAAFYHVPELRILTMPTMRPGEECHFLVKLSNPTQHPTTVQLLPLSAENENKTEMQETEKMAAPVVLEEDQAAKDESKGHSRAFSRQGSFLEPHDLEEAIDITGDVKVPSGTIILPARDDAAEYDDFTDTQGIKDDPKVVAWRKSNKAAIHMTVVPADTSGDIVVAFFLQYEYLNTILGVEQREPQRVELKLKIHVNLGRMAA